MVAVETVNFNKRKMQFLVALVVSIFLLPLAGGLGVLLALWLRPPDTTPDPRIGQIIEVRETDPSIFAHPEQQPLRDFRFATSTAMTVEEGVERFGVATLPSDIPFRIIRVDAGLLQLEPAPEPGGESRLWIHESAWPASAEDSDAPNDPSDD